jgi:5-(carboxyamino)imidazole ribonucleotide synthase
LGVTGVMAGRDVRHRGGRARQRAGDAPHNSGHWTIEGARTSQFEQHLRAVLDLPLGDTG